MNYGDPRVNGSHAGIDIENVPWRTRVVAAEAGRVRWHTTSARAGCMLYLYGRSGTTYLYIHLNNDLTERSEDRGGCKLEHVVRGRGRREGDGGRADRLERRLRRRGGTPPPLRVHPGDGADVNPVPVPQRRRAPPLPRPPRRDVLARDPRRARRRRRQHARASGTTAVRWWPGGQWTSVVGERPVTVAIGAGAAVDTSLAAALASPSRRSPRGRTARVVTALPRRERSRRRRCGASPASSSRRA